MLTRLLTQCNFRKELFDSWAILVDAENVSPNMAKLGVNIVQEQGKVGFLLAFGDWTKSGNVKCGGWQELVEVCNLERVQVDRCRNGKNSTDIALAIQAVKLQLEYGVTRFLIVSSDCDFLHLVRFLRGNQCLVYGVGTEKTDKGLRGACSEFFEFCTDGQVVHNLTSQNKNVEVNSNKAILNSMRKKLVPICVRLGGKKRWIDISLIGNRISNDIPNFEFPKECSSLLKVFLRLSSFFEIKRDGLRYFVKVK